MSNDSIRSEARYLPSGPPRLLGWNVPPEEIVHIPDHWLVYPEPNPSLHYMLILLYFLYMFLAIPGNGLVIWIFCAAKSLRTPSNMFVVNLAVCDFLMMIKSPIFIYNAFNHGFALGNIGCQVFGFMGSLSGIGAAMTNAAIAYDRYSTIARPLDGKLSRGQVLLFILCIWTYTVPWGLMPLMDVWGRFVPEGFLTSCSFDYLTDSNDIRTFVATIFTFSYAIPMMLIIYYYSQIVSHVVNHEKALREQAKKMNVDSLRSNAGSNTQSAEIRIAKAAITICFLFVLSWTPYGVMAMIGAFGDKSLLTPGVTMIPAITCKAVACLDPYVYAISHPRYRLELQKRLPWLELQEKPIADSQSTTTEAVNAPPASS
ncbi:opsin, ultraviolet-sensitive [Hylaeus volcanicus]|uniref:opsin, ultraviolet-sensitive n=1 Tax=Hylaeus volcanicus TaxID=313075 RepID=UPI0023B81380|nr:opsin, ultraviolet-sensitive [Hylaeus volcanicus]